MARIGFAAILATPLFADGTVFSWTNNGVEFWSKPSNWTPSGPPTLGSVVVIDRGGFNPIVFYDSPAGSIAQMNCNEAFVLSSGELDLDGSTTATQFQTGFTINGGKLATLGGADVQFFTTAQWNAGTLGGSGAGKYIIRSTGAMTVDATHDLEKVLGQDMDINGSLTINASINPLNEPALRLGSGVTLTNNNVMIINSSPTAHESFGTSGGVATFTNEVNKQFYLNCPAGAFEYFADHMVVNNKGFTNFNNGGWAICTGTYNNASSGTLYDWNGIFQLASGGASSGTLDVRNAQLFITGPGYDINGGTLAIDSNSVVGFHEGTSNVNINYSNPGYVYVDNGGIVNFSKNFDSRVDMVQGTMRFSGTSTTLRAGSLLRGATMSGTGPVNIAGMSWTNGVMTGGTTTVLAGAQLDIDANDQGRNVLSTNLINNGVVNITSGTTPTGEINAFDIYGGPTITNNNIFTLHSVAAPEHTSFSAEHGTATFINSPGNVAFNVIVDAGGIDRFGKNMIINNKGSTFFSGGGFAACDGEFDNDGYTHLAGGVFQLNGGGTSHGNIDVTGNCTLYVTSDYTFAGPGTINVDSISYVGFDGAGSTISDTINSNYVNSGQVYVKSGATVTFTGQFDSQVDLMAGTLRLDGPSSNLRAGSILRGSTLSGSGPISITGLNWTNGTINGLSTTPSPTRTVVAGGELDIDANDGGRNVLNANLINNGTIIVNSGTSLPNYAFDILDGATITNNNVFTLHSAGTPDHTSFGTEDGGVSTFTNSATVGLMNVIVDPGGIDRFGKNMQIKNNGSLFMSGGGFAACEGTFTNNGYVHLGGGVFELAGRGSSQGNMDVGPNSILFLTNNYTFNGGLVSIDPTSSVLFGSGTHTVNIPWVNSGTTTIDSANVTFIQNFSSNLQITGPGTVTFKGPANILDLIVPDGGSVFLDSPSIVVHSVKAFARSRVDVTKSVSFNAFTLLGDTAIIHKSGGQLNAGAGGINLAGTANPTLTLEAGLAPGEAVLNGDISFSGTGGMGQIVSTNPAAGESPGRLSLGSMRTITVNDVSADVDLLINAQIRSGGITKSGGGKLQLVSPNNYALGTNLVDGTVEILDPAALGSGSVTFSGGTLSVRSDAASTALSNALVAGATTGVRLNVGRINAGTPGVFQFSRASFGSAIFASGAGTVAFTDSTLTNDLSIHSSVPINFNGAISGNYGLSVGDEGIAQASVTLSGGAANTYTGTTTIYAGTLILNHSSGDAVPADLRVVAGSALLQHDQQIADGANVALNGGVFDLNGYAEEIGSLSTSPGSQVLMHGGAVAINYTGASPLADIETQLAAGRLASGNPGMVIAVTEASAISLLSFRGFPIDATTILIRDTCLADANLDGSVNTTDFTALAKHFNSPTHLWSDGDFNYDGFVNALDFNALATNFGQSFASPALGSLVPEPFSISWSAAALLSLRIMRRRKA